MRSGFAFLTDGDRLDGVWEAAIEFPPFIRSGEWNLEIWFLHDRADNSVSVRTTTLREMGFPTVLTVVSEEDATPPRLTSIQISPNPVDVTSQDQPLTVALRAMDAQSGGSFFPSNGRAHPHDVGCHRVNKPARWTDTLALQRRLRADLRRHSRRRMDWRPQSAPIQRVGKLGGDRRYYSGLGGEPGLGFDTQPVGVPWYSVDV